MKCLLYLRTGPESFTYHDAYDAYLHALTAGQANGHATFTIDTKSRVPSRATQLGEALDTYIKQKKTSQRSKKNKLLEED